MAKGVRVKGASLRRIRECVALTQGELASALGMTSRNLQRIEGSEETSMGLRAFRKLVQLLPFSQDSMRNVLVADPDQIEIVHNIPVADDTLRRVKDFSHDHNVGLKDATAELVMRGALSNVDPYSKKLVSEIPIFDLAVAAGSWTEIPEEIRLHQPGQVDAGMFGIRVRGDSMKPRWPDGSLVVFRCMRDGRDMLEIGEDYYVQVDGQGTFKRLEKIDEETLVFRAINRRKYPAQMPARRAEIVRMAKALHMIVVPEK